MKISEVYAFALNPNAMPKPAAGRRPSWLVDTEVANPMSHYPKYKALRELWLPSWPQIGCVVKTHDGQWGFGMTNYGTPTLSLINNYLGKRLIGEDANDIESLWEMMTRLSAPFGVSGLPSYAISAIDLALWDLKGKHLNKPVYELIGDDQRSKIKCYSTGNDTDWHMELGFEATKLACPFGPADAENGLDKNEELVAKTRQLIGPDKGLMLDCWMAFDVEFVVSMSERLVPYNVDWLEDCLTPEDIEGHHELRRKLPGRKLASGEHWYGEHMFAHAAKHRLVDVFQPDICWVGGLTACNKIAAIADNFSIDIILHAGMNTPFGQHFTQARNPITTNAPMGEYFVGSQPGAQLPRPAYAPAMAQPINGLCMPTDAPGFGLGLDLDLLDTLIG